MLPLYKHIERHLKHHQTRARRDSGSYNLDSVITLALLKLERYIRKALESDYPLLGAGELDCLFELHCQTRHSQSYATVLHPTLHLSYFDDTTLWPAEPNLPECA